MSSTFDHQAQLYSDLLSRASALKAQRQGGKAAPPPEGEPFGASHKLCFGALGLDPPSARCADPGIVTDYEAAKEVFKLGSAYVLRAKGFLVLDGFVTDHFAALNLETGLYQLLAAWEPDFGARPRPRPLTRCTSTLRPQRLTDTPHCGRGGRAARRLTMHKRRLELLKAVELINETAYLQISRQVRASSYTSCPGCPLDLGCAALCRRASTWAASRRTSSSSRRPSTPTTRLRARRAVPPAPSGRGGLRSAAARWWLDAPAAACAALCAV
jgi:hypothetical protein